MRHFAIVPLMLLLAACAAREAGPDLDVEHGDANMGVLAGSLSTDNPGNIAAQQINVFFDPVGDTKGSRLSVAVYDHCSPGTSSTDFQDRCGKLFAIVVPAGSYALAAWNITDNAGIVGPRRWNLAAISVQPGKVTYIGEIHMAFNQNLPGAGPLEWRGWPVAWDAEARDIPALLKRYSRLRADDFIVAPLKLNQSGELCVIGDPNRRSNTICR